MLEVVCRGRRTVHLLCRDRFLCATDCQRRSDCWRIRDCLCSLLPALRCCQYSAFWQRRQELRTAVFLWRSAGGVLPAIGHRRWRLAVGLLDHVFNGGNGARRAHRLGRQDRDALAVRHVNLVPGEHDRDAVGRSRSDAEHRQNPAAGVPATRSS
ncbi:MAG: hypothetical protein V5B60_18715 [Accumulibacter sp.]|uniref:hypothetical protein n=1 Tax=Accumulibacter sp. TaxID=2053492 RepID=UPI002FC2C6E9